MFEACSIIIHMENRIGQIFSSFDQVCKAPLVQISSDEIIYCVALQVGFIAIKDKVEVELL